MTPEEKPFDTSRIPVFYQNGSVKVGDKEYAPGEYPLGTDAPTNKITADAVEALIKELNCFDHIDEQVADMLRDLFTAREECERQFQEKVAEIGRLMDELAAANERIAEFEAEITAEREDATYIDPSLGGD